MMASNKGHTGVLHQYAPRLVAFEWTSPHSEASSSPDDELSTIIFVGGLFDDLLTVPFAPLIPAKLPSNWRFMQARLSSSSYGWGLSSLDRDVKDIQKCVAYVRRLRPKGKVVLMGHSTGSQDVMHWAITSHESKKPRVDGYILQASISDREGTTLSPEENEKINQVAREYVERGDGEEVLPKKYTGWLFPCSANRWLSLASPGPDHNGQDDFFSSDLGDERFEKTFGKLGETKAAVQILYSGADEHVPGFVDKEALVAKWHTIIKAHGGNLHEKSGVVPGMDHTGEKANEETRMGLVSRVVAFAEYLK